MTAENDTPQIAVFKANLERKCFAFANSPVIAEKREKREKRKKRKHKL